MIYALFVLSTVPWTVVPHFFVRCLHIPSIQQITKWKKDEGLVLFTPSLGRVRRPCRGLEKFFPPVLQRCYGCSFDAQEIVHTGHGMLGFFFFFRRERCLPKVSWKSNPAAPGLANQVWPFKSALYVPRKTLMVGWGLLAHASRGHLRWSGEGWACLSSFQLKGLHDRTRETHS